MIITIDGVAGAGKSTAARLLAERLGFGLLNTGGMYRAAALHLLRHDVNIYAPRRDADAIARIVAGYSFDTTGGRMRLNDEDMTDALHLDGVGAAASKVATFPEVRAKLKVEQQRLAVGKDIVCEGRDQGTAVFPDADVKFFVWAEVFERARRRAAQKGHDPDAEPLVVERLAKKIQDRDVQDFTRPIDPLRPPHFAVFLDTTARGIDLILTDMAEVVARCRSRG